jgi:hypothetical protein
MVVLKDHPVWQNLSAVIQDIDANALALEHLALCNYQLSGYWDDDDRYHETISLPPDLSPQLISSGVIFSNHQRRIQLKFNLMVTTTTSSRAIAELLLIYDENLEFIDEQWHIDLTSEFIQLP